MRKLAVLALLCSGCIAARPKLMRDLHNDLDEVQSAESAELPYRARAPELQPLIGAKRDEITDNLNLGPTACAPRGNTTRCTWRFSARTDSSEPPLFLHLDFDAKDVCNGASWSESE